MSNSISNILKLLLVIFRTAMVPIGTWYLLIYLLRYLSKENIWSSKTSCHLQGANYKRCPHKITKNWPPVCADALYI